MNSGTRHGPYRAHAAAGLGRDACMEAFKAHDTRFDGLFFVSNRLTGVYCRPVCRVRFSRPENFDFHPSAAAAEARGYRPCLRCRPELAPGRPPAGPGRTLAGRAAVIIERDLLFGRTVEDLSSELGVTGRHLRRAFDAEFGVPPVRYLQTRRLLTAKSLLTDTGLPVTEVAFASGFSSQRRFNDLFRRRYRMSPTGFKRASGTAGGRPDAVTLEVSYRPPYAWQGILDFLGARAAAGVEETDGASYRRVVGFGEAGAPGGAGTGWTGWHGGPARPAGAAAGGGPLYGWIEVSDLPARNALAVTVSPGLMPALPRVLSRARALFDTDCEPLAVSGRLAGLYALKPGSCPPGVRLPGAFDPFETAVRAVLGQQVTVKAAGTLAGRLASAFGAPVETPFAGLSRAFPGPGAFLALGGGGGIEGALGPLGVTGARSRSILALAEAVASGRVRLDASADPLEQMGRLKELPGFGDWTVQYVAMRALGYPDAFPHTDLGVRKALAPLPAEGILALAEEWRPWRGYAAVCLWNSLAL